VQTDEIKGGNGALDKFLYECPDLFPLPVPGKPGEAKWLIQGGSGEYLIGNFDGSKFTPDAPTKKLNRYGGDFYAAQTFTNAPNGRIVQIGWMRANTPGMPFNQCMSVPLDLSLQEDAKGLHLAYAPVEELKALRGAPIEIPAGSLGAVNVLAPVQGDSFDFEVEIKPGTAQKIAFKFRGLDVTYDVASGMLQCKKISAPVPLEQGVLKLRMMLDRVTLDIFAAHGAVYAPVYFLPPASDLTQSLTAIGGSAEIVSLKAYPMASSWQP
jgi:fructan beta-fructosidase